MTRTKRPKFGAHVSTAGGLHKGFENAERIGAECIQIFGASPRQWRAAMPSEPEIRRYSADGKKCGVSPVFLHAAYLVNLASANPEMREKSIESLANHLHIAENLHAAGLIFHLGSSKDGSIGNALEATALGIQEVFKRVPGSAQLIMENSSGGGSKLGGAVVQIGALLKMTGSRRIKVCIDTAHAFESGMITEFSPSNISAWCGELDREIGLEHIVALHINDSKTPANSGSDRHENLGKGFIGLEGFKNLAAEKRLHLAAWILEVPGFDGDGPDKKNLETLKSLFLT